MSDLHCSQCNISFHRWHDFSRHVSTVHDPLRVPFQCSQCEKIFSRRDNFVRHLKTIHDNALEKLNCEECKKQFARKDHFMRHMRCTHPEKFCAENDIADTNELYFECWACGVQCRRKDDLKNHIYAVHGTEEFECDTCGGKFKYKKNLLVHFRKCPYPKSTVRSKVCILCGNAFVRKPTILKHYREYHHIEFEEEDLKFESVQGFLSWKNNMEKSTNSRFIVCNLHNRQQKQITITQYVCHRSGPQIIKEVRSRKIKLTGSKKLNAICPAEMKLYQNHLDSTCSVTFRKTHVGHDLSSKEELNYLCSPKNRKTYPKKKESDISRCSNDLNTSDDKSFLINTDLYTLEKHDISSNCNIHNSYPTLNDDPGNIETFVRQYSDSILYYKKLHETSDTRFPFLRSSDMVLIFMSPQQESLLQKHGDGVIAVDWTYGTNPYHFNMHTVLVLDYDNEAVPVVFAISNRSDFEMFDIFLTCIKERVNILQPNTLMTGLKGNYYDHWKTVMGAPQYHLFCTRHVRESWKTNIKKIKNKSTQKRISEILHELSAETDAVEFNRKLNALLNADDSDLFQFLSYFRAEFIDCVPCWANCYWPVTGSGINMQLESYHHSLKYVYNRCRRNKTSVYAGLTTLVQFLRSKLKSTTKHGKMTFKLKGLRRAHEQYVAFATKNQNQIKIEEIDDGWLIQSFQTSKYEDMEKVYVIRRLQETCPAKADGDDCECELTCPQCRVCAHLYCCTCVENAVRNNMCKHIHAILSVLDTTSAESILGDDEMVIEENPFSDESTSLKTSVDKNGSKQKLFKKLSDIITFVSAAESDQLRALETLLESTASAVSNMVSTTQ